MAKPHSIAPFPADIDRDTFGHWLSGFTDGEGCFTLFAWQGRFPKASFTISLRDDDRPVLELIRSYFGTGAIYLVPPRGSRNVINQQASFKVCAVASLASVLVPHFLRYPLRAKKARDFVLWSEAVQLMARVVKRKRKPLGIRCDRGTLPKWTAPERSQFIALAVALKKMRKFEPGPVTLPATLPEEYPLFDS